MATYIDPYATAAGKGTTTTNSGGTSTSDSTGTTNSTGSSNGSSVTNTSNMDANSMAALQNLIAQLQSGGTASMRADTNRKNVEIGTLQQNREGYSKEAAFADAKGLIAQTMRQTLEKLLPGINTASLGAGASQSSMRALLTQRAAENASEAASAQGLTAATNYGNVSNGMSGIIANLMAIKDPATDALLQALGIAKGAQVSSTTNTTNNTTNSGTSTNNTTSTTPSTTTITAPTTVASGTSGSNFTSYGPIDQSSAGSGIGSTNDLLNQLYGGNTFSNYVF